MAAQLEFPTPKTTGAQCVDWRTAVEQIRELTGDDLDSFIGWWAASNPAVALDAVVSYQAYRQRVAEIAAER